MREERFPWGLGLVLVLVIVGGLGFWLGSSSVAPVIVPVAAPVAPVAPAPAPVTPVYPAYAPHGGGFPLIPLFFGLLFLFVIIKVARRAAWASHNARGYYGGPGTWSGRGRGHGRGWYGPRWDADAPVDRPVDEPTQAAPNPKWPDGMAKARDFWNSRDVQQMVDQMFERWHTQMHGRAASAAQSEQPKTEATDEGSLNLPPTEPPTDAQP